MSKLSGGQEKVQGEVEGARLHAQSSIVILGELRLAAVARSMLRNCVKIAEAWDVRGTVCMIWLNATFIGSGHAAGREGRWSRADRD